MDGHDVGLGSGLGFDAEGFEQGVEGGLIFVREDNDGTAEAVFERVDGDGAAAGFGAGSGGAERVAAVGRKLTFGCHGWSFSERYGIRPEGLFPL